MSNPLSQFGLTDQEIDAEMARDPKVMKELEALAKRVEDSLKDKAPVFDAVRDRRATPGDEGNLFVDSIHTEFTRLKNGLPAARVGSDHYLALPIEIGNVHMPEMGIFAQTAAEFDDTTGPVFSSGVQQAQSNLRDQVNTLAQMRARGESSESIASQQRAVSRARADRAAAFKASRGRRGRSR